jgi:nucleotide-binding universal stress UspA family protein
MPDEFQSLYGSPGLVADRILQRAAVLHGGGLDVEVHIEPGGPVRVLLAVAQAVGADLIVVGNRGSVGRRLARRARCDVLVVDTGGAAAA